MKSSTSKTGLIVNLVTDEQVMYDKFLYMKSFICLLYVCNFSTFLTTHAARNATDLMQVVDFTGLMQEVLSSLLTSSSCIKSVNI
jgi:hypothetical protein